eukprot:5513126-Pyramimonas_sp.AAC.1
MGRQGYRAPMHPQAPPGHPGPATEIGGPAHRTIWIHEDPYRGKLILGNTYTRKGAVFRRRDSCTRTHRCGREKSLHVFQQGDLGSLGLYVLHALAKVAPAFVILWGRCRGAQEGAAMEGEEEK